MVLIGVVCIGPQNELGVNNHCCYRIPEDRTFFKTLITGQTVIVGRKTYESMPKSVFKLCKDVFVLTTALIQDIDVCHNIHFTNSIDDVIKYFTFIDDPVYVIGGQCIYKYLEKYIDTWYITHVNYEPKKQADTFFDVDLSQHKFMSVLQTGDGWEIVKHYK